MHFTLLVLLAITACTPRARNAAVIPEEKFAAIYASLIETGEASQKAGLDTTAEHAAADSVLRSAGVTADQFRATVQALNADVRKWKTVSDAVARILEERATARADRR
ncbi:MAG TPA: hypothetical protein VL126_05545 [Bacteroidota bacterium]|nr:hypothetical protein [Bacteroidota bacterium]